MAEGESDNHYNFINGEVYICYWNNRALKEYILNLESSLPVSEEECLKCSLEKCLSCNGYCPSTKTYSKKKLK